MEDNDTTETVTISQTDATDLAEGDATIQVLTEQYGPVTLYSGGIDGSTVETEEAATSLSWDSFALEGAGASKKWDHIDLRVVIAEDGEPTDVVGDEPSISEKTAGTLLDIANDDGGNDEYQRAALEVLNAHGYNVTEVSTYIFEG